MIRFFCGNRIKGRMEQRISKEVPAESPFYPIMNENPQDAGVLERKEIFICPYMQAKSK